LRMSSLKDAFAHLWRLYRITEEVSI
jgi:hypothetical protein